MKKLFIASIGLWLITAIAFGIFFVKGSTQKSTDNRSAVMLAPAEKDLVLDEMRKLLTALNKTLTAIGANKMSDAIVATKAAGMGMAVDVNPVLMAKLPLEFKKLGMGLHADFDQLSKDMEKGMTQSEVITRLGTMTNKCIACHNTYRLP